MKNKILKLSALYIAFVFCAGSFADDTNVYVRLYTQRVEFAKADVRKQEAETHFQAARFERARILVVKNAISREEYDRTEADYKMSVAQEDVLRSKVGEEEATLDVVKQLVQGGQPVPFCKN
jgi:multidrug resistance efflux pump